MSICDLVCSVIPTATLFRAAMSPQTVLSWPSTSFCGSVSICSRMSKYQFSHTIEEQIGGQIKAGFRLVDLYEDTNSTGFLKEHGVPTFWATLAIKE